MMRSTTRLGATLLAVALVLGGCGADRTEMDDLALEALDATTLVSRSYTYVDKVRDGAETSVEVVIEDDFRYEAAWSVDGTPVYEEVVWDDALAARADDIDRVLATIGDGTAGLAVEDLVEAPTESAPSESASPDPDPTASVAASEPTPTPTSEPEATSDVDGADLLASGAWVIDEVGAPALATEVTVDDLGGDPIVDAVGVLTLARTSVKFAPFVGRWDDSAIEYDPDDDPFRAPEGEGDDAELRYDVAGEPLISRASVTNAQASSSVTSAMLRRMAVFVRDGLVTEIRISINTDAEDVFEAIEKAYELPTTGTDQERAARAMVAVNEKRAEIGDDPIVPRDITVTFHDVGTAQNIKLPPGAVASLAHLANRGSVDGQIPVEPTKEATDDSTAAPSSEPTSTTEAGDQPSDVGSDPPS